MDSQPMKYDSLRVVLHYFEANKRIQLAARIPSIRKCEKTIPLKIDYLSFKEDSFTINKTRYEVNIHRHYYATQTRSCLQLYGDCKLDMDKYGHEDQNTWKTLEPGDIVMNPPQLQEPGKHEIEMIVILSQANQKFLEENGFQNMDELTKCMNDSKTNREKATRLRDYFFGEDARFLFTETVIEQTKYRLQCLYSLRDDTPPPFKPFLQLKLYKNSERPCTSEIQHIELVEYKRKLPDAIRSILKTVFEGRKCSVMVDTFAVDQSYNIRAPADLKLKIQKLKIHGSLASVCNSLHPIIDSSSFPLTEVFVENLKAFTIDFHHHMVENADKIIIGDHKEGVAWLPILLAIKNKIVVMKGTRTLLALEGYIELIRSWVENGRPVGTTFIFDIFSENLVEEVLHQAAVQHRRVIRSERCVTIPTNKSNLLQVFYEDNVECFSLIMKVLPTNTDIAEQLSGLHIE